MTFGTTATTVAFVPSKQTIRRSVECALSCTTVPATRLGRKFRLRSYRPTPTRSCGSMP
jgi:hypothetical protein